ncbi:MAG: hypothetical protein L3V56_13680 [Candidatus Magnetoovum sp. WYHC-5]|nr:hypothetical protein [Candidatus Magnetoovum sp. WYHC-5]
MEIVKDNKDKVFCPKRQCFKYVVVCKICHYAKTCKDYQKYVQPRLFME